ncbi:MAG: type II secretion system F family protein [Vibrio sp.]
MGSEKVGSNSNVMLFYWQGRDSKGKKIFGKMLAINEEQVRDKLIPQGIKISRIKSRSPSVFTRLRHRITAKEITLFTRQLATMLATGIPVIQSIKLIANNQTKISLQAILSILVTQLESGTPISQAMKTTSHWFDPFYCDLVSTGEQTGNLAGVFERLATYREKREELGAKVIKAMIYPSIVILVAIGVSILMLTIVIPEFETMFKGFGAELPWFTQQVILFSHFVQNSLLNFTFLMVITIVGFKYAYRRSFHIQLKTSTLTLKLPVLGSILSKAAIAKFSRTLATSFSAGIPILSSLQTTAKTSGNLYYQMAIEQVHKEISSGTPLYIGMRNTHAFPEMVLQMIMIGEESGNLDGMLNKIAAIYEFEVDNTVDNLGKIIEPAIIVFLGVVVGGLVVALYMPIFKLVSVF